MPIYEYACGKCEHEFEVEQRISDDPVKTCPACRSRKVKRLISQTSFVLKGSGWYSDLYSSSKGDKADKGAEKSGDGEGKSGSDDKAAKSDVSKSGDSGDSKSKSKTKGKGAKAAAA